MDKANGILYTRWIPAHLLVRANYLSYSQITKLRKLDKIQAKYLNTTLMIDMESIEASLTETAIGDKDNGDNNLGN
jgi:hypothetical protein